MQAFGQHAADDDSEREEVLEGLNFFDEQDEDDVDDEPGHRVVEPIEDFDLVEDEDEDGRLGTSRPESALAPDALGHALFHHHGMRANALHMKTVWHDVVTEGDSPAISAPLADLSLLSFECTCIEGHHIFNEVVSLPTTGVNTHRIWMMENFLREIETYGRNFTVHEYHEMLATVEGTRPDYRPVQQGLAAGAACGAFVFLLGGGPIEMLGAFVGAGIGNFVRSTMLSRRIGQFSALAMGVAVACVCYLLALLGLSRFDPMALAHEEGYIGAMLFVIPGFPLITAGLDISKLDMRSGIERLTYAVSIVVVATLVGWVVAECVGLSPDDFAPQGLGALQLTALRASMSFVGVFGFSTMFNSPVQMAAAAGCIGAVSNTLRLSLVDLNVLIPALGLAGGVPPEAAALIGALVSGLLASVAELKLTYPRIALTVPSIVIMVPGLYLYRAMYYMCVFDTANMLSWFVRAVLIVAFLPVGLGAARTLTDPRWRHTS